MTYAYRATVVSVTDGDSLVLDVDLGFYATMRLRFRLMGYNAPETRGPERELGQAAADALAIMLPRGTQVEVCTHKGDSFGRWLADVAWDGVDLVEALISAGWGVPWDGKGKRPAFDPAATYPLET